MGPCYACRVPARACTCQISSEHYDIPVCSSLRAHSHSKTLNQAMALQVTFRGVKHSLPWTQDLVTLQDLARLLASELHLDPESQKIVVGGRQLVPSATPDQPVQAAGIHAGSKILVFPKASSAEIAKLQAVPDQRIRGFDDELLSVMRRRQNERSSTLPSGPHTFQRFESWSRPGLQPAPSDAMKLLHRLAADKGIVGVMAQHRWTVGALTEMPPEGKVGVSAMCILGVNINRGQEISLRLRTDDLKGFRRYDRIRETLIHELAHMVFGEHDNNFKELNSQLLRESKSYEWTSARSLVGEPAASSSSDSAFVDPSDVMAVTAQRSGQKLGGHSTDVDVRRAAGLSAMQRIGQAAGDPSVADRPGAASDKSEEDISGLGHHDDMTEELEQKMRALGSPNNPATPSKGTGDDGAAEQP